MFSTTAMDLTLNVWADADLSSLMFAVNEHFSDDSTNDLDENILHKILAEI